MKIKNRRNLGRVPDCAIPQGRDAASGPGFPLQFFVKKEKACPSVQAGISTAIPHAGAP